MDVDGVLAELSAEELAEWQAYDYLEPFGEQWQQTALLASLIANANRDVEQHPEPFQASEFLPPRCSWEAVLETLDAENVPGLEAGLPETAEPDWMSWKRKMQILAEATKS